MLRDLLPLISALLLVFDCKRVTDRLAFLLVEWSRLVGDVEVIVPNRCLVERWNTGVN